MNLAEWQVALICMAIVICSLLVSSLVKFIYTKITTKKGKEVDKKKLEYPLASISLVLSFALVAVFLKYVIKMTDSKLIAQYAATYAGTVETVYLFLIQLPRKGVSGVISAVKNIYNKIKTSKEPIAELPELVKDEIEKNDIKSIDSEETKPAIEQNSTNIDYEKTVADILNGLSNSQEKE